MQENREREEDPSLISVNNSQEKSRRGEIPARFFLCADCVPALLLPYIATRFRTECFGSAMCPRIAFIADAAIPIPTSG
jgi:hypothetical protein